MIGAKNLVQKLNLGPPAGHFRLEGGYNSKKWQKVRFLNKSVQKYLNVQVLYLFGISLQRRFQ